MDTSHITVLSGNDSMIISFAYDKYSLLYFNIRLQLIFTGAILYLTPWTQITSWKIFGIVGIMIFLLYAGCQSYVYWYFNKEIKIGLKNHNVFVNGHLFCKNESLKCIHIENIRGRYGHGQNVSLTTDKKQEVILRKHLSPAEAEMIAGNIAGFLQIGTEVK